MGVLEAGAEERKGAFAGEFGGSGFVIGAMIAVEAVAGVFVEEDSDFGMGLLDFLDIGGGDVFVFCTKVQHDGAAGLFPNKS